MSKDFQDVITRLVPQSDIMRVYPNASVVIYAAGTTTPTVWSGAADEHGVINIETLPTGHYDLYVAGSLQKSFHHIKADYATKHPETWTVQFSGTINADINEVENHQIFFTGVVGKILKVSVVVHYTDATGDATVHILKGSPQRADALNFTDDSIWSVQCNPQSEMYDWSHVAADADLAIEAERNIAVAIDYTAGSVKGVTVTMIFKAD